jgi:hypothetical protein
MGVPTDYAIHRFIDLGIQHDVEERAEPIERPTVRQFSSRTRNIERRRWVTPHTAASS